MKQSTVMIGENDAMNYSLSSRNDMDCGQKQPQINPRDSRFNPSINALATVELPEQCHDLHPEPDDTINHIEWR
jgi:hypothetical protein